MWINSFIENGFTSTFLLCIPISETQLDQAESRQSSANSEPFIYWKVYLCIKFNWRGFHWAPKTSVNTEDAELFGKWIEIYLFGLFLLLLLPHEGWHRCQEKSMYSHWKVFFFLFLSCIWAGHDLYQSGLLELVQKDFLLQVCLTGVLWARWVQLCTQRRFIFYVCVKTPAMNLTAQSFTFILYSSVQSPAHFHRLRLQAAWGWAERTKAKNRCRNSGAWEEKGRSFSSPLHSASQINMKWAQCLHSPSIIEIALSTGRGFLLLSSRKPWSCQRFLTPMTCVYPPLWWPDCKAAA